MWRPVTRSLCVLVLPALLVACQLADATQLPAVSPAADPGRMTCAAWLETTGDERLALADQLVGSSGELLERIRIRQHHPEGTPRDTLVRDVAGSLTKNCEVWPPRSRQLDDLMDALY